MPKRVTAGEAPEPAGSQRLDKWLWFTRVVKSRTMAAGLVQDGRVRVNRERVTKPSQMVKAGDVVTLSVHRSVRVLRVTAPGVRRGPAAEAAGLYEDLSPQVSPSAADAGANPAECAISFEAGAGRPTKKDRRAIDLLRDAEE